MHLDNIRGCVAERLLHPPRHIQGQLRRHWLLPVPAGISYSLAYSGTHFPSTVSCTLQASSSAFATTKQAGNAEKGVGMATAGLRSDGLWVMRGMRGLVWVACARTA